MNPKFRFCVECEYHSQEFHNDGLHVSHKCKQTLGTRDRVTGRFEWPDCRVVRETMCRGEWFDPKSCPAPKKSGWFIGLISKMFS